jgi:hypothetical protein|tara:strand:- start:204 stop:848 length:645 start_codon:yes stop_codon:yes gene_type:complete
MAGLRTITDFKTQLRGGGARPNLFEVDITNFGGGTDGSGDLGFGEDVQTDFRFFCKASAMPTQTIGSVDVPFRGRILKVAGDRTFEPWSVTVINDESFGVRKAFERWGNKINALHSGTGEVSPEQYMGSGLIKQLGRSPAGGNLEKTTQPLQTYIFQDIWPSEIGSIDLSYESSDALEEFTVTFQVQYIAIGSDAVGKEPGESAETASLGSPAS